MQQAGAWRVLFDLAMIATFSGFYIVPLYALTNWSGETFHHARARYDFLGLFRGILVSGDERPRRCQASSDGLE